MRRKRCPKASLYLNMQDCKAYKVKKNRKIKETEQNGRSETDKRTV